MIDINKPAALLGGLSPDRFMRTVWQKDYRLIRQAIAGFQGVVTANEVRKLATRDDVPSRLIIREGTSWHVEHGPFSARALRNLPSKDWTILVQDLNTVVPDADALLRAFAFIPYARLDDVMVSLAAPGGGVGPHFDSYDVFLLQGQGHRRWRISAQKELTLREDVPLKILKRFKPTQEWVLEPGDMLYLPPQFAHDGVALDECLTFSIGFRAPSESEVWVAAIEHVLDGATEHPPRLAERKHRASETPGMLPAAYVEMFQHVLTQKKWTHDELISIAGTFASSPKPHIVFEAPSQPITRTAFARALRSRSLSLDPRTILLCADDRVFINGEAHLNRDTALRVLANRRCLEPMHLQDGTVGLLYSWVNAGWIKVN
jgi:50S ribosomal protein L16 3-hydroxylase